jgi:signal transduction histidine kinase
MPERPRQPEDSIRTPILIPFVLLLIVIVAAVVGTAYVLEDRAQQGAIGARVEAVRQLMQLQYEQEGLLLHVAVETLINDPTLQALVERGERAGLEAHLAPLFEHLRERHGITHLYVDTPELVNLLRAHDPARNGDIIDRVTARQALTSEQGTYGMEVGTFGTLTLRTVVPWRSQGRLIGVVEMGKDISNLADEIKRILNIDLVVLVRKDVLDRQTWSEGSKMLGRREAWDALVHWAILAQTMGTVPSAVRALMDERPHSGHAVISTDNGERLLYAAFLPLLDVAHRQVGDILVVRDVTRIWAAFWRTIELVGGVSLLAAGLALLMFMAVLKRVDRSVRRRREIERQFLRLSSDHERIIQIEKLSAVGKTITEIAHQLNNPLVGVINLSQLAERSVDDRERTRGLLAEIRRAGEDCRDFVQRMLDFAKISRSERAPTNLQDLVQDTVRLLQQSFSQHPPVQVDMPGEAVVLTVDRILLRHALFNLMANAVEAQGSVDAAIGVRLERRAGEEQGWWGLSVLDRGSGISKDRLDDIFVPFFSTRPEGTGLGLPVAQHVALIHGGRITVSNRAEGGAQFTIWLPDEPRVTKIGEGAPGRSGAPLAAIGRPQDA